jgi:hypothetical protein
MMMKKQYKTNKMNSNFTTDFKKQAIFTAQTYGTKTTVEVDHSDLSLDEVMDVFQTLIIGMGYHENSFKKWVTERAEEYNETDAEDLKEKLEAWKFDDESDDIVLRHQYEDREELENDFFGSYDAEAEKRMDIIGQNGNDGLHYRATEEDEAEFDDYGKRIEKDAVSFEWGDEPEEDYDGQFDDWKNETPEDNLELKEGYKKYKKALKTLSAKQKKKSK